VHTAPPTGKMHETGAVSCAGLESWPGATSVARAMPREGIQGDEWTAYVTLDTYSQDVPRDRLQAARPMVTESQ